MIKGKYVATVEINISVDENSPGLLPFETIRDILKQGKFDNTLASIIEKELGDIGMVRITPQYADLYRVEEEGKGNNG